jgi:hypothetical protein
MRRNGRIVGNEPAIVVIAVLMMLVVPSASGQFREEAGLVRDSAVTRIDDSSASDSIVDATKPEAGEKMLYLTGAALGFALFDYVGYNLVRNSDTGLPIYRVVQVLTQLGVSWLLYEKVGLPTAIAFNLIWWTWGLDAIYYGYTELFNAGGSWERRGAFRSQILGNHCTWASWTPVGISRGMDPKKPIAGDTLIAQFLVGAGLAVTISLNF